jgi:hypothetical protein
MWSQARKFLVADLLKLADRIVAIAVVVFGLGELAVANDGVRFSQRLAVRGRRGESARESLSACEVLVSKQQRMRGHKINELAFGKTEVVTVLGDPLCESGDARALDDVSDLRVHGCLPWLWENRGRGRSAMRTLRKSRIRWIAKSLLELLRRSEIGPLRASDRLKLRHRFARVIDIQRRLFRVLANGDRLANLGVPLVVSREG